MLLCLLGPYYVRYMVYGIHLTSISYIVFCRYIQFQGLFKYISSRKGLVFCKISQHLSVLFCFIIPVAHWFFLLDKQLSQLYEPDCGTCDPPWNATELLQYGIGLEFRTEGAMQCFQDLHDQTFHYFFIYKEAFKMFHLHA